MFHVVVLGGVGLVDCGARTDLGRPVVEDASAPVDASDEEASPGFPQETAFAFDAGPPDVVVVFDAGFPNEANAPPPGASRR